MNNHIIKKSVGALVLAASLLSTSCVPKIANLAKGETVPQAIATYVARDARLLVLPLWSDIREHNFRDPYIIAASAIGTPEANVPRRTGFYFDFFVCGGPSKYVMGYLVVADNGTFVWSDVRGERQSSDSAVLKKELTTLVLANEAGSHLRDLMKYDEASEIGFYADEEHRQTTLRFLAQIPNEE